jgi:hypothetical protein
MVFKLRRGQQTPQRVNCSEERVTEKMVGGFADWIKDERSQNHCLSSQGSRNWGRCQKSERGKIQIFLKEKKWCLKSIE